MTEAWSLTAAAASLAHCWQRFFHAPADGRVCAAIRIGYASLVLIHFAVLYPDLELWFTGQGVLPLDAAQAIANPHAWSIFWWLGESSAVVQAGFWLAVSHAVLLLAGLAPRLNAALLFVWLVSFQSRNPLLWDGEDVAMRMIGFFLIWMPIGRCWSLGPAFARRVALPHRPTLGPADGPDANFALHRPAQVPTHAAVPGWGLRLLQLQMALIYFSAALEKLQGESWLNGTAVYYVARLDDFFGRFPVPAWLFDTPWTVALMTWSVVLVELLVPFFIWFRETRRACLAAAVLFHLANEWTMHLFLFHWIMLVGWISFATADDFDWRRHL